MFDNNLRYLKNDPLMETVKNTMQNSDLHRQAVDLVNEEFGVYSRKALVREQVAAYDARLEEAFNALKEGKKLSPAQDKELDVGHRIDGKIQGKVEIRSTQQTLKL